MTFVACLFLSIGMALAQSRISGKVTSAEDGQPVVGATIKVVGSKTASAITGRRRQLLDQRPSRFAS